jgi:hypothetical protein
MKYDIVKVVTRMGTNPGCPGTGVITPFPEIVAHNE